MFDKNETAGKIAAALMVREMAFIDRDLPEAVESYNSIKNLLKKGSQLNYLLFCLIGNDDVARVEYFGIGNGGIEVYFDELRNELHRLSITGRCDRNILSEGEAILNHIIEGVNKYENEMKEFINPAKAEELALFTRQLLKIPVASRATPNEIDEEQATALAGYQWARRARQVLESVQAAVKQINHEYDRGNRSAPTPVR